MSDLSTNWRRAKNFVLYGMFLSTLVPLIVLGMLDFQKASAFAIRPGFIVLAVILFDILIYFACRAVHFRLYHSSFWTPSEGQGAAGQGLRLVYPPVGVMASNISWLVLVLLAASHGWGTAILWGGICFLLLIFFLTVSLYQTFNGPDRT